MTLAALASRMFRTWFTFSLLWSVYGDSSCFQGRYDKRLPPPPGVAVARTDGARVGTMSSISSPEVNLNAGMRGVPLLMYCA